MIRVGLKCYPFIITVPYEIAELCAWAFYRGNWTLGNTEMFLATHAVRVEERIIYATDMIPVEMKYAA